MKDDNTVLFAYVTPQGLERDSDGATITRVGKLPRTFSKETLKLNDLLAISNNNEPFKLGVVLGLDSSKAMVPDKNYVMTRPNQEDALIGFVKRLGLQTGRTKPMHR